LFVHAKDLFIAATVDGSALRADGLIADEADRSMLRRLDNCGPETAAIDLRGPARGSDFTDAGMDRGFRCQDRVRRAGQPLGALGSRPAVSARPPTAAGSPRPALGPITPTNGLDATDGHARPPPTRSHDAVNGLNRKCNAADKAPEQPWSTSMLAEIFMLRLEATARAAKEAAPPSRFVPITLPAAKAP